MVFSVRRQNRRRDSAREAADGMIAAVRPLLGTVLRSDASLTAQMKRAASSAVLNIAEGSESLGGNKRARYRTALGSAAEVEAALDVAQAWGYLTAEQAQPVRDKLRSIRRMLSRLGRQRMDGYRGGAT